MAINLLPFFLTAHWGNPLVSPYASPPLPGGAFRSLVETEDKEDSEEVGLEAYTQSQGCTVLEESRLLL